MLSFDKVSAHYGKIRALHEVSLHINQGEIVTLIGANGRGKPPCSARYAAIRGATSGRIVCDDKDITDCADGENHARSGSDCPGRASRLADDGGKRTGRGFCRTRPVP